MSPMDLAETLAQALAKYREDEPWDTMTEPQRTRHRKLGALLAADLMKSGLLSPSLPCTTQPTVSPQNPPLRLDEIFLSPEAAVEVSVAVPLTVGGVTGALSIKSVRDIFTECLKQIEKQQKEQQHVTG